jgi:hypothetical protein
MITALLLLVVVGCAKEKETVSLEFRVKQYCKRLEWELEPMKPANPNLGPIAEVQLVADRAYFALTVSVRICTQARGENPQADELEMRIGMIGLELLEGKMAYRREGESVEEWRQRILASIKAGKAALQRLNALPIQSH